MSHPWDRPKRSWGWWVVLLALGAVLLIPPVRQATQGLVARVGAPLVALIQRLRARPEDTLTEERQRWQEQIVALAVDQARVRALEEENALLRQQANVPLQSGFEGIGAQVLSRTMTPDRAAIVINRGQRDALEVGQAVLAGDGLFIGKVSALNARTATVELLTDPRSRIASTLSGERRVLGVVEGRGNGAARMTYIPSSQIIKKDQIIVTSGTEEKIPPHLPLGLVNAVEGKNTDPFISAILEPLLPLDRLSFVTVLRPQQAAGGS